MLFIRRAPKRRSTFVPLDNHLQWRRPAAVLLASLLLASSASAADAAPTDLVNFGSQVALHDCVTLALDSEQVTEAQLASLTSLTCNGGVTDISVLAGATGLTSLDLKYNGITDVTALAGLTNLTFLAVNYQDVSLPATKPNQPYALPVIAGGLPIMVQQGVIGDIADGAVTWAGPGLAKLTWSGLVGFGSAGKQTTFSGTMHQFVKYQLNGAQAVITGVAKVGEPLTAIAGIGNGNATYSYTWMADAVPIAGASASTYTPVDADLGKAISVEITVEQGGYFPFVSTSATTAAVIAGDPKPEPTPTATHTPTPIETPTPAETSTPVETHVDVIAQPAVLTTTVPTAAPMSVVVSAVPAIRGTAKVGKKLTVKPGAWTPGASLSYRWFVNGKAVSNKAKLTVTKAMRGKKITVRVTGSRPGYVSTSATSKATAKVK